MKRLVVLSMLLLAFSADAQKVSIGFGGGGATNTAPSDNMEYKGDQTLLNYALTARLIRTTKTNWQYGIVGHMHELSMKSSKVYGGFFNRHLVFDSVGGDGKKLVYAKYTVALCGVFNRSFDLGPKTSAYIGVAAGYGFARNNSLHYKENEGYKGADGGHGLCLGGQLGINTMFNDHVGFFFDVAARYYKFKFDAGAPQRFTPPEDLEYSITAIPITIGLTFNLHSIAKSQANTYNMKTRKYY